MSSTHKVHCRDHTGSRPFLAIEAKKTRWAYPPEGLRDAPEIRLEARVALAEVLLGEVDGTREEYDADEEEEDEEAELVQRGAHCGAQDLQAARVATQLQDLEHPSAHVRCTRTIRMEFPIRSKLKELKYGGDWTKALTRDASCEARRRPRCRSGPGGRARRPRGSLRDCRRCPARRRGRAAAIARACDRAATYSPPCAARTSRPAACRW